MLILLTLVLSLLPWMRGGAAQAIVPTAATTDSEVYQAQATLPEDGIYLYGQQPEPEQIGVGYMIFEASQQSVIGAFYMPNSSFDCFEGRIENGALALNITNSYTEEVYAYSIPVEATDAIASATGGTAPLQLEGFHQLQSPSANDLQILATCQAVL